MNSSDFSVNNPSTSLSTSSVIQGESLTTYWSGFTSNVNIKVYKGATYWTDANANASGSGSQSLGTAGWEIRSDYNIKVELRSNTAIYRNTQYFSVNAPILPDLVATRSYMASISTPGTELGYPKVGDIVRFNCEFKLNSSNINSNFKINCYLVSERKLLTNYHSDK